MFVDIETIHLRLGLEPMCWDSNLAKTRFGMLTCVTRTRTQPKPKVFQLRADTLFQDLMKLRLLMSHCRKNSVRDKVIGKKWIYLQRDSPQTEYGPHGQMSLAGCSPWGCKESDVTNQLNTHGHTSCMLLGEA